MNTRTSKPAASPVRVHRVIRKSSVRAASCTQFAEILIAVMGGREDVFLAAPEFALHTFPAPDSEKAPSRNRRRRHVHRVVR